MRSMYRIYLENDRDDYKDLLAVTEVDAVYRWATLFNISHKDIFELESSGWSWKTNRIIVELTFELDPNCEMCQGSGIVSMDDNMEGFSFHDFDCECTKGNRKLKK